MKYLIILLFVSLFILKLNSSKKVDSIKNQTDLTIFSSQASLQAHETKKVRKIINGKRHRQTRQRKKTRNSNRPLKKRGHKKLSSRSKAASSRQSIVFSGDACDFVDFGAVRNSGSSCSDGSKMVLKNS